MQVRIIPVAYNTGPYDSGPYTGLYRSVYGFVCTEDKEGHVEEMRDVVRPVLTEKRLGYGTIDGPYTDRIWFGFSPQLSI